jgi:uncharacterized protein YbjT (DUF2867 family)
MNTRTALVFGATGLVGNSLVRQLCDSRRYGTIKVYGRRHSGLECNDIQEEYIVDFSKLVEHADKITGDDLFICLGSTLKKAGSVENMEWTDRDLPAAIAAIASMNTVSRVAVISSVGADPGSRNYYLRIKGEMEKKIMDMIFSTVIIARPSVLLGQRNEKRPGETAGKVLIAVFGIFMVGKLSKYRGIKASDVAKAMIIAISTFTGTEIIESDKLQRISQKQEPPSGAI